MKLHVATALLILSHALLGQTGQIQSDSITLPASAPKDKAAVKQLFFESYSVYTDYAFGHDDVAPIAQGSVDGLGGWGASIVDALGTMVLMGFEDWIAEAVKQIGKTNFNVTDTDETISVFETTIRWVGGLLSAYELTGYQYPILLEKAQQIGDKLVYAWSYGNTIPFGHLNFTTNSPVDAISNIAEAASLSLEFGTLSKYTKNQTYANLALKAVEHIAKLPSPLPGLAAQDIDPVTGNSVGGYVTWGGGSDSCFEYYAKYTRLFNPSDTLLIDTWATAVDSSIRTLMKTSTVGNHVYIADLDDKKDIVYIGSHLECFAGGNWILGGKMLNNDTIVKAGLQFVDACWNTYAGTQTGIGPEVFAYISPDGNFTGSGAPNQEQLDFYNKNGFYILTSDYVLRPEVLESNFYAWRATGDVKYYNRALAAVKSFNDYLIVGNGGAAGLNDVNNISAGRIDDTESFWFAEVLKYLYLTFDNPETISLDEYVFNTECHPLQAPTAMSQYGSGKLIDNSISFQLNGPNVPAATVSAGTLQPSQLTLKVNL
ncbi:glycoside hydrolase family 47 protein [Amanita rubescens]|nr:glycoside hydrolase family 47 protein [Amanita rubescens]